MTTDSRRHNTRIVRAPHGPELTAKSWMTEAPLRMLMNNLDPEVAENPNELVVYCLLYTSPSPRDQRGSRMPSSA